MIMNIMDTYDTTIDHSEDITIRTTKDGRIFGIKNIRQEFAGLKMTLKAGIAGDVKAGEEYLDTLAKGLMKNIHN